MRRLAAAVLLLCLLTSLQADEKKQEPPTVTAEGLYKDPARYHGKLVRLEGVLESDLRQSEYMGVTRYHLDFGIAGVDSIVSFIEPGVSKGDRVRLTGKYTYKENSFVRHRLAVEVPAGKIEKLPAKKEEKQP